MQSREQKRAAGHRRRMFTQTPGVPCNPVNPPAPSKLAESPQRRLLRNFMQQNRQEPPQTAGFHQSVIKRTKLGLLANKSSCAITCSHEYLRSFSHNSYIRQSSDYAGAVVRRLTP
jgi:hypothetical protein